MKKGGRSNKDDDEYIPPEIEEEDDDIDEVLRNQKPSRKRKKSKRRIGKKRKQIDLFNLSTLTGQLLYILREEDRWMQEAEIREKLVACWRDETMQDWGKTVQVSSKMGVLWKSKKVNRKGFPGGFYYKLADNLTDSKFSKKKKRKIGNGVSDDREEEFSPPNKKKVQLNRREVLLHILRKGEFLKVEDILMEFKRITHRREITLKQMKEMLKKEELIEYRKLGKKKKGSVEFRLEEEEEEEEEEDSEEEEEEESELQPLPMDFESSSTTSSSETIPDVKPPPPPIIFLKQQFKCPFDNLITEKMSVGNYLRKVFQLNADVNLDCSEVSFHLRNLKITGMVYQETSKSMRIEIKGVLDQLEKEKSIVRVSLKNNNVYLHSSKNNQNECVPPPPPPTSQNKEFVYPNSHIMKEYIESLISIELTAEIGSNNERLGMKENIYTAFLERKTFDEDQLEEEGNPIHSYSSSSEKGVVVLYTPNEPPNSSKLRMLEQCQGFPRYLRALYYGPLNKWNNKLRNDVLGGITRLGMTRPFPSIQPPPTADENNNIFCVIYECQKEYSILDLAAKEFVRPCHMFEFVIQLLNLIFEMRRFGMLISPNLNQVFFDCISRSDDNKDDVVDCSFSLQIVNPLISSKKQVRFVDMYNSTKEEEEEDDKLSFPSDFVEDVKMKLITLGWKFSVCASRANRTEDYACFDGVVKSLGSSSGDLKKIRDFMVVEKMKEVKKKSRKNNM